MSWNAYLHDDRGHLEGDWNYTHNTSRMIYDVLERAGFELAPSTRPCSTYDHDTKTWTSHPDGYGTISWYDHLDGLPGPEGAAYLDLIIRGLEADPGRYREMNPENGWGDYDSLLKTLCDMRSAVPEWPTAWSTSG